MCVCVCVCKHNNQKCMQLCGSTCLAAVAGLARTVYGLSVCVYIRRTNRINTTVFNSMYMKNRPRN